MRIQTVCAVVLVLSCGVVHAGAAHPVRFEPNRGQADARFEYVARTADGTLLLGDGELRLGGSVLSLVGAAPDAVWEAVEPLPGRAHYLLGSDAAAWILDVPTYGAVRRRAAYPGIDVVVRGSDARIDLEFVVASSADLAAIGIALDGSGWKLAPPEVGGVDRTYRSAGGALRIEGTGADTRSEPVRIRVSVERGDRERTTESPRLAADGEGNLYLAGHVAEGPATAFVSQLDASGREVLRTTYVDGLDAGAPLALAVAPTGEVVLAGAAKGAAAVVRLDRTGRAVARRVHWGESGNDAALAVAFDPDGGVWCAGRADSDAFVTRIDAAGEVVFTSTFGGKEADEARGIALGRDGAVLTGSTASDAFVAKLDAKERSIAYFTPFGGSGADAGAAIAVTSSGEPVIVGTTRSTDLPIVGGTQAVLGGGADAFLARWDRDGRSLVFSTYLGGPSEDEALALALDRNDRAWVAGSRGSGESADAFVTRVAANGEAAPIDRIVAGDGGDAATGIVVNGNGDAVVAGLTRSAELPGADRPESAVGGVIFVTIVEGGAAPRGVCPGTRNFTGLNSNAWEDLDNWSGHVLPTSSDDVCIQGFNVVAGSGLQNAGTLRVEGGSLTLSGAQITVAGASEVNAPLSISSGTLTGAGNITVSGTFSWTGGTMGGSGITTTTGAVSIGGALTKALFAHRWDVNGPVTWTGTGSVTVSSGAVINNASTWDCQSDASLIWAVGAATAFNNSGTFKKSAGVGTTTMQAPFYNTGSVLIETGLMNFNQGGSSSSSWNVPAGTTLEFLGSTYNFDAGTTITGAGTFLLDIATLNVNAPVLIPSPITFNMQGGILGGLATLTVNGPLNWTGGTMQSGVTTANGALNISGGSVKGMQFSRVLNVNATATFTGTGSLSVSSLGVINNAGTWDCQSDATIIWGVGTATSFNNTGTFKKSAGAGTTTVQMPFVNTGAVLVQSGIVNFNSGSSSSTGSFDVAATRTLQFGGNTWALDAGTTFSGAGKVLLSATTLNVNAAVEIPATMSFDMTGGIIGGLGTFTVRGPFGWSGGTMQSAGITNCNGPFNISGAAAKGIQSTRVVNTNATTNLTGSGSLSVSSLGVINNTGTWDCQSDATIIWAVGSATAFNNSGTFKKSAGTTTIVQMPFYNTGTVLVQTGTINMAFGGSSSNLFDIAGGTTLLFNGGTFNLDAGTTFTGLGTIVLGTATWNVNAAVSTPLTITLNMSGSNATMNGSGTLTTFGPFNWTAGTMGGAGATTCEGLFTLSGTGAKGISARTFNTNGITTWSGAGANLGMSFAAALNNNGTWEVVNDATILWGVGGAPIFRNFGTFRKSVGTGTTSLQLPFSNSGTVDIQSGTISATGYTQTAGTTKLTGGALTSGATIAIQGGTLAGSGTVTGPVVVSGTGALSPGLSSAGALSLATSYVQQAPSGAFDVELGGTAPAQYDRAAVTGAATFAGILNVTLINGFIPQPGNTFTIMTYGSHTGSFTLVLPSAGCIGWLVHYGPTALVLTAATVPAEVTGLDFTTKTALSWTPAPIYAATSYNVLRGDLDTLPVGPGADETCVVPTTTATSGTDATTPAAAKGFWYLVREQVAGCGPGTYGFATSGSERVSTACP